MDALHGWLTAQLGRVSGKSTLAEAIRYALRHWQGLVLFLEDGRLELDTNTVERTMRGVALGRKNSLFAGSNGGARRVLLHEQGADKDTAYAHARRRARWLRVGGR